jgi:microcystin-dependent protein
MFGGNFSPAGWAFCDGSLLPISENDTLFNLIGTTYGGDGQSTFGLPDLRGRVPLHQGTNAGTSFTLAQSGGTETVTLTTQQIPMHSHALLAVGIQGTDNAPGGNLPAIAQAVKPYVNQPPSGTMNPRMLASAGGAQAHENRQPYLAVNFIISLFGIYPQVS